MPTVGQQQPDEGEAAEQDLRQAAGRERLIDDAGERLHVVERNRRLDFGDDAPHVGDHARGRSVRAYRERSGLPPTCGRLTYRCGSGGSVASPSRTAPADADDREPGRVPGRANALAERLGAFPVAVGERHVDDADVETRRIVGDGEVAAEQQRNAHRLEVVRDSRRSGTSGPRCRSAAPAGRR